jgi:hypothetical protein
MKSCTILVAALIAVSLVAPSPLTAQAPPAPKAAAPIDLTGYWVALITEDWRIRMMAAPKGDYYSLPINDEARKVADTWDPAKDIAEGKQCMSYGAPGIMRVPGRLHVTWDNDATLKIETDAGRQTRIFSFGNARPPAAPSIQGFSIAQWMTPQATREYNSKISAQDSNTPGFPGIVNGAGPAAPDTRNLGGRLRVVTTHLRPGYIRNNGVPYSGNATMTEFYDIHRRNGEDYLVVTQIIDDPQYLNVPWVTSNNFRRERDGSKWDPRPCELILPAK